MADKRFLSIEDLGNMPVPQWLIEGLFESNSLVMLAGPSNNYKSFLAIDWTMCMAAGRKWNSRPTLQAKVLYALGEGKANLLKRLEAWMIYHKVTPEEKAKIINNFRVTFEVPQLAIEPSVSKMLAGLEEEGFQPNVIVIDTFARSFVGLDENDAKDTGLWIQQADRLRQKGYTVIFLHHTAKNTEFGLKYRGSTAIMGAMDTAFTLCKDKDDKKVSTLECTKQKDHDEGNPLYFARVPVKTHPNEEGSIVLVPTVKVDDSFRGGPVAVKVSEDTIALRVLHDDNFKTVSDKGRELARLLNINEETGRKRIERLMPKVGIA